MIKRGENEWWNFRKESYLPQPKVHRSVAFCKAKKHESLFKGREFTKSVLRVWILSACMLDWFFDSEHPCTCVTVYLFLCDCICVPVVCLCDYVCVSVVWLSMFVWLHLCGWVCATVWLFVWLYLYDCVCDCVFLFWLWLLLHAHKLQ